MADRGSASSRRSAACSTSSATAPLRSPIRFASTSGDEIQARISLAPIGVRVLSTAHSRLPLRSPERVEKISSVRTAVSSIARYRRPSRSDAREISPSAAGWCRCR